MKKLALTRGALLATIFIVAGCQTLEVQTPERIRAREPVLFENSAILGRLSYGEQELVHFENIPTARLLITPTTIYWANKNVSYDISLSIVESAAVEPVYQQLFWPLGEPKQLGEFLVIRESRGVCYAGCVFRFGPPAGEKEASEAFQQQSAAQVAELINSLRQNIDPFGRTEGPRRVWLGSGLARAIPRWQRDPRYLEERQPNAKSEFEKWMWEQSKSLPEIFQQALVEELAALKPESNSYEFEPVEGLRVSYRGWLDPKSVVEVMAEHESPPNSLLVSDIDGLVFDERIRPPDGRIEIEVSFEIYYDFYDLVPPKNGAVHNVVFKAQHSLDAWMNQGDELLRAEVQNAAKTAARRISSLLYSPEDSRSTQKTN